MIHELGSIPSRRWKGAWSNCAEGKTCRQEGRKQGRYTAQLRGWWLLGHPRGLSGRWPASADQVTPNWLVEDAISGGAETVIKCQFNEVGAQQEQLHFRPADLFLTMVLKNLFFDRLKTYHIKGFKSLVCIENGNYWMLLFYSPQGGD